MPRKVSRAQLALVLTLGCLASAGTIAGLALGRSNTSASPFEVTAKFQKGLAAVSWPQIDGVTGYALLYDGTQVAVAGTRATSTRFSVGTGQHTLTVQPLWAPLTTTTAPSTTTTPTPTVGATYFAADSPWNTPIAVPAQIRSQSATWMGQLYNAVSGLNVNQGSWTPTRIIAAPTDPRATFYNANGWILDHVPTPANLIVEAQSDAHAVIVNPAAGLAYDFFSLARSTASPSGWTAGAGVISRLNGSGWWNNAKGPWAARASGASLLGGLILAGEAKAAVIPHALGCAAPKGVTVGAVSPATTGDGNGPAGSMPMGSRLQLDPAFDTSTLEPGEQMIAKALQVYGCYITDSSSSFAFYAENFNALPGGVNPYPSSWSNGITRELVKHFRVVDPPPAPVYDDLTVLGQPHK